MSKDAYYFPHDSNAIQDPKMMTLLSECGLMGIGMFWIIIEILHQQKDGKITSDEFKRYLSFYYRCDDDGTHKIQKIEQVLNTSGLLLNKDGFVYSERVIKNKEFRSDLSKKRSIAGKKSAELRFKTTNVEQVLTSVEQGKERKGKEIKGNNKHFSAPLLEEVEKYFKERNTKVDPKVFHAYYEANGWVQGKNKPIKNWKSCLTTWENNGFSNEVKKPTTQDFNKRYEETQNYLKSLEVAA